MTRLVFGILLCLLASGRVQAQSVVFSSSNLPIVLIDTEGQPIPDEPKITAHMSVIDNGPGARNNVTDPPNGYDGLIGIEMRGASSQLMYPKKSYGVETRDETGDSRNVKLLGFPKENDWVLYGPYDDKTLLRNDLAFWIGRRMGHYASRSRFCEVVINGSYMGLYALMEKIKIDKNRVAITEMDDDDLAGDSLTGGYVFKIDKAAGGFNDGWASHYGSGAAGRRVYYLYDEPDPEDIQPAQKTYLQQVIRTFEDVMASEHYADPAEGYHKYIDLDSFVDYFLLTEVTRNIDGYRLSAFFYKDRDSRGGKIHAGPIWDYNFAFGNADYYGATSFYDLQVDFAHPNDEWQVPFWWPKLVRDTAFTAAASKRLKELRSSFLHTDSVMARIDEQVTLLSEARLRQFQRWPVTGRYIWANGFVGRTYEEDLSYLKTWLQQRLQWMDGHLATTLSGEKAQLPEGTGLSAPYPNPFRSQTRVTLQLTQPQRVRLAVYDALGREVLLLHDAWVTVGTHPFAIEGGDLPSGVYFVHAQGPAFDATRSIVRIR